MTKAKKSLLGWIICGLAAISYCYEYLLRITPSVMVNELMEFFQANATEFGTMSAFFYFTYTPMQMIVGPLSDIYGPRRILTLAVVICVFGNYLFGISDTLLLAALGRALIGFGSSFAFVCILKLADSWLPQRFFALFVGLATALGMLGAVFQISIFSSIVTHIGWRKIINLSTIAGLVLMPFIWVIVRDRPKGITEEKTTVQSRDIFRGLVKILKNPQMWINGIIACILYSSLSLFAELWGMPFLINVHNLSNNAAASACSMVYLGWLFGSPVIGYLSDFLGSRKIPIIVGFGLSMLIIVLVIYLTPTSLPMLRWLLFFFGVFTSAEILCFAISTEINPRYLIATASAFTNFLTMLSGFIAQPLIGKMLDILWSGETINNLRIYSGNDYRIAFLILPLILAVGLFLSIFLNETKGRGFY